MTFSTVKSNPYDAGIRRRRRKFRLWPASFIREITKMGSGHLTPAVVKAIGDMNQQLYGKR